MWGRWTHEFGHDTASPADNTAIFFCVIQCLLHTLPQKIHLFRAIFLHFDRILCHRRLPIKNLLSSRFIFHFDRSASVDAVNVLRSFTTASQGKLISDPNADGIMEAFVETNVLTSAFGTLDVMNSGSSAGLTLEDLPRTDPATGQYSTGKAGSAYDVSGGATGVHAAQYAKFGKNKMMYLRGAGNLLEKKVYEVDVSDMVRAAVDGFFDSAKSDVGAVGSALNDGVVGFHLFTTATGTGNKLPQRECTRLGV